MKTLSLVLFFVVAQSYGSIVSLDDKDPIPCPKGSFPGYEPGVCYSISKAFLSFPLAQTQCQKQGGNLASIHDDQTNNLIASQASKQSFILQNPIWLGGQKNNQNQWTWTDGSNFSYTKWGLFQPNIIWGNDCLLQSIASKKWFNDNCWRIAPYVCEFYVGTQPPSTPAASTPVETTPGPQEITKKPLEPSTKSSETFEPLKTTIKVDPTTAKTIDQTSTLSVQNISSTKQPYQLPCLDGWAHYTKTESCYYLYAYQKFIDGEHYCQTFQPDSHLASVHNIDENGFILSLRLTGDVPVFWLGLYSASSHSNFRWTDGTPVDFTFFADGKPDNNTNANCVGIVKDLDYGWSNLDCDAAGLTVCKMPSFVHV